MVEPARLATALALVRIYQDGTGGRREIRGGYAVGKTFISRGKSGRTRMIAFRTDRYDPTRPLVIDPMLVYSTYLGGSGDEMQTGTGITGGTGMAVDSADNVYLIGTTTSTDFPTTTGVLKPAAGGNMDAFVSKLNPAGTALLYSTYLGGTSNDVGEDLAVDLSGNLFLTGWTASADFPTTAGALQTTYTGKPDVFITKLNSAGSALLYSTYLGSAGVGTP